MRIHMTIATSLLFMSQLSVADIIHVPGNVPTVQDAVDAAVDGDTILLGDGTYSESVVIQDKSITLTGESSDPSVCKIEGSTAALFIGGAASNVTVRGIGLSGSNFGDGLEIGPNAIVTVLECEMYDAFGHGVSMQGLSLTMTDCVIRDCSAAGSGAGLFVTAGSVTLEGCSIQDNTLTGNNATGAGIFLNSAELMMSNSTVEDNTMTGNFAEGAGLFAINSTVTVAGSEFLRNHNNGMGSAGGGLYIDGGVATVRNSLIRQNQAYQGGGLNADNAIFFLSDCELGGNQSTVGSGAAMRNLGSDLDVQSCTLVNNTAASGAGALAHGAGSTTTIGNSIITLNTTPDFAGVGNVTATYSNIPSGFPGEGNITAPPTFVAAIIGNFRLAAGSAGIDAGNALAYGGLGVDRAGNPRVIDDPNTANTGVSIFDTAALDMGAFEYQPVPVDEPDTCPADINGDGSVEVQDLVELILAWGVCP